MRRGNGVFSAQERKIAMWALLIAGVVAALGSIAQQFTGSSVGPGGVDAYATASSPDILDARPIA